MLFKEVYKKLVFEGRFNNRHQSQIRTQPKRLPNDKNKVSAVRPPACVSVCNVNKLSSNLKYTRKERIKIKRAQNRVFNKLKQMRCNTELCNDVNNLPVIPVTLHNNLKTNALIDSGSSINCISKNLFETLIKRKLIKKHTENNLPCYSADSSKLKITGCCVIKIKIHRFSWNVKFYVMPRLNRDLLLGNCFMRETNLILDLNQNKCYFRFSPSVSILLSKENCNGINSNQVSEINVGCMDMRSKVLDLVNQFPNVFTMNIGKLLNTEFKLKVKDSEIVNLKPYPLGVPKMKIMKEILTDLLDQKIIRPSTSAYSSPSFLVKKPNSDKHRLVINYSKLNSKIERVNYPIGNMADTFHYLQGAKYFSVIDLSNSFLQIPLHEDSKHLTAFSTPYSLYEFNTIPYGLHCGSGLLSAHLDRIFRDIKFEHVINFIDDLLVFSKSKSDHLIHLREVIDRLSKNNLTVNPSKAKLFHTEITYLGHLVSHNCVKIDPSRTEAIRQFRTPKNAKEVGSFIGMVSFFSSYIPSYATLASSLNELRKKKKKFVWSEECQQSFVKLKEAISNPPVLAMPNFEKPFVLMTDASEVASGSVLLQANEVGDKLPVAYFSKKFTESERNLTVYEKEALSIVLALKRFQGFLEVRPFYLITDNQALSWVLSHFRKLGKLSRWVEYILSMPFTVLHVKGKDNPVADCLSRIFTNTESPIKIESVYPEKMETSCIKVKCNKKFRSINSKCINNETNVIQNFPLAYTEISNHQVNNGECNELIQSVRDKTCKDNFYLKNNVLMYKKNDRSKGKIYVPPSLFDMLFEYFHNSYFGGHPGQTRTIYKICEYFYHPELINVIRSKVKNCETCKKSKPANRIYEGELLATQSLNPLDKLYVDLAGPLPRSKDGNNHILIAVDDMTKYVWLIPIPNATSKSIIKKLETIVFCNFGSCKTLISDNGACFKSSEFKHFMFKHSIRHYRIVPRQPSANRVERYILNVKNQLRAYYHNCQNVWDKNVYFMQQNLNTAYNESTKATAFQLMFKHKANHSLSNLWGINDLLDNTLTEQEVKNMMDRAIQNCKRSVSQNKNRARYNEDRVKHPFKVGSIVYLKNHSLSNKVNKYQAKMDFRYNGPYRIIYFTSPVSVILQDVNNFKITKRAHIKQLKLN